MQRSLENLEPEIFAGVLLAPSFAPAFSTYKVSPWTVRLTGNFPPDGTISRNFK
jgi:hypothetical protein